MKRYDSSSAALQPHERELKVWRIPEGRSPIIPVMIGDNQLTLEVAARLQEQGCDVRAIRPPSVPQGTARLRITVNALHEPEELRHLVSCIVNCEREFVLRERTVGDSISK